MTLHTTAPNTNWQQSSAVSRPIWILVGIWLSANLLNTLTTAIGLSRGFVEISPVPRWALSNGGPLAMWGLKLIAVLLLPMILQRGILHGRFSQQGARAGLAMASLPVICTVLWESWLLGWMPVS